MSIVLPIWRKRLVKSMSFTIVSSPLAALRAESAQGEVAYDTSSLFRPDHSSSHKAALRVSNITFRRYSGVKIATSANRWQVAGSA